MVVHYKHTIDTNSVCSSSSTEIAQTALVSCVWSTHQSLMLHICYILCVCMIACVKQSSPCVSYHTHTQTQDADRQWHPWPWKQLFFSRISIPIYSLYQPAHFPWWNSWSALPTSPNVCLLCAHRVVCGLHPMEEGSCSVLTDWHCWGCFTRPAWLNRWIFLCTPVSRNKVITHLTTSG